MDRQLRYFLKIAEHSSLSKAADELDVSQSGLSRQLSALEAELGHTLFSRTGRGVALTEVGKNVLSKTYPRLTLFFRSREILICRQTRS